MPLHEWRALREKGVRAAALKEQRELFAGRVAAREILDVVVPTSFSTSKEVEEFLASLSKENRKLVTMTNKEFRALQGAKALDASRQE
jgi:predicted neutral ceramidase superfamily lipid hydrolase